ncbi:hypothetical protein JOC86_004521 [Bacillus pakistanensis]|uniref:Uncharacterized protein n=1 Tax=Rossellomorea pakistanensis TaxID=992288 RepID=A0ABS2NJB5_9BACI|nr:hypothetical protein [Bacillus pakistanensis]
MVAFQGYHRVFYLKYNMCINLESRAITLNFRAQNLILMHLLVIFVNKIKKLCITTFKVKKMFLLHIQGVSF